MSRLLLGVTGGIAAYKAAEITSAATKRGLSVRIIMTPAAVQFITPLTFEALSGHPVMVETRAGALSDSIDHIDWAKWADVACVAPLTASTLGKLACGIADNALCSTWLAIPPATPRLLCPAMNTVMWQSPIVQRNCRWLEQTGRYHFAPPVSKRLACGDVGVGALADPSDILDRLLSLLA